MLIAPLACIATDLVDRSGGAVACSNMVGRDYTGGPGHDPPLWPAGLAGALTALGGGLTTRFLVSRRPFQAG